MRDSSKILASGKSIFVCFLFKKVEKRLSFRAHFLRQLHVSPIGSVNNGSAADFCDLLSVAIKRPAADFCVSYHVLEKHDSSGESQAEFVEQLNALQQIIVRRSEKRKLSQARIIKYSK